MQHHRSGILFDYNLVYFSIIIYTEEEDDIEFARNKVEYTVQLAQHALDFFDKMDISNNKSVSDADKEELLAEAVELRQQVDQLRAKLKTA